MPSPETRLHFISICMAMYLFLLCGEWGRVLFGPLTGGCRPSSLRRDTSYNDGYLRETYSRQALLQVFLYFTPDDPAARPTCVFTSYWLAHQLRRHTGVACLLPIFSSAMFQSTRRISTCYLMPSGGRFNSHGNSNHRIEAFTYEWPSSSP
jgi:hypothetical protein